MLYFNSSTGAAILAKLVAMLKEWDIPCEASDKKPVTIYITTDNGRNMVNAATMSGWGTISCFAHSLQLAINDVRGAVPELQDMLSRARAIVGHYKRSSSARNKLKQLQKQLSFPIHELIQDVDTRWNSEYLMLCRLEEQREPVSADLVTCNVENLTNAEWRLASSLISVRQCYVINFCFQISFLNPIGLNNVNVTVFFF